MRNGGEALAGAGRCRATGSARHWRSSFNQNSSVTFQQSTFAKLLRDLEKIVLLSKSFDLDQSDEDAFNRDVFALTANGTQANYARQKKTENQSFAPDAD